MPPANKFSTALGVNRAEDPAMLHGKWILTRPDGGERRNTETERLQPDGRWQFVIDNPYVPRD